MLTNSSLLKGHGYVNGKWVGDDSKSRFDVTNAYSNEVIITLPDMGKKAVSYTHLTLPTIYSV